MYLEDLEKPIKKTKRGWDRQDSKFFSKEALQILKKAQEEIQFLLERDYPMTSIIKFVGDRYQLSTRQRTALQRATCGLSQCKQRLIKELNIKDMDKGPIYIDGFNLIITLEVALSGGVILLCQDDMMRDLAGLRGTYRLIDKTDEALIYLGKALQKLGVKQAVFYLDAPVSNSGNLKLKILEHSKEWNIEVSVQVVNNPDVVLREQSKVATSDAIILDECMSYFNLVKYVINHYVPNAYVISLNNKGNKEATW